jgi:REP element-mobilizing transposase RayT
MPLASPEARNLVKDVLERIRKKYKFFVAGYVVMPEQVHMLVNEPGGPVINPEESPSALRSCAPFIAASSR